MAFKTKDNYDDKFDDVMKYVELHLNEEGSKVRIRNKDDLKVLMEQLDKKRKGGDKRLTSDFIESVLRSRRADAMVGKMVGKFGTTRELSTPKKTERQERLKTNEYRYEKGTAVKATYKINGKTVVYFRDAKTGRRVSKRSVRDE
jgi:hypothetical protein